MISRDDQLGAVTIQAATRWAKAHGSSVQQGLEALEQSLKYTATMRREDAFSYGYEPPIWLVAASLMKDYPADDGFRAVVKKMSGMDWETFAPKMREACGFERPVDSILIMGANRSGKTDWASKMVCRASVANDRQLIAIGSQLMSTSRKAQQSRVWHYLPKDLRAKNGRREHLLYLNYKAQTGFSQNMLTLENGSSVRFVSYEADCKSTFEGAEYDKIWLDEEFSAEWLETAIFRCASRLGTVVGTFTPLSGYTAVVADYLDEMVVTRWSTAYMLPKDGGEPLPWAQLGLTKDEYTDLLAYHAGKTTTCTAPEARPENVLAWLDTPVGSDPENLYPERWFDRVPRVAKKRDGAAAILWFHGRDNPYGKPSEVILSAMEQRRDLDATRTRVYGLARKLKAARFPGFSRDTNVIEDRDVPQLMARTMVCDPAPERNWCCMWMGIDAKGDIYVYREWPSSYEIPTVGTPGPWAVISTAKAGVNDGDRGDAQEKFGFGMLRYKAEWARLEGWRDAQLWARYGGECPYEFPRETELEQWTSSNGTHEPLRRRVLDSRAGSQSKISHGEDRTLFELCADLDSGTGFQPASGRRISSGLELIEQLLSPLGGGRKMYVAKSCINTIFALQHFTGADGQKGACKDLIDCLRYGLESGIMDDRPDPERDQSTANGEMARKEYDDDEYEIDWLMD